MKIALVHIGCATNKSRNAVMKKIGVALFVLDFLILLDFLATSGISLPIFSFFWGALALQGLMAALAFIFFVTEGKIICAFMSAALLVSCLLFSTNKFLFYSDVTWAYLYRKLDLSACQGEICSSVGKLDNGNGSCNRVLSSNGRSSHVCQFIASDRWSLAGLGAYCLSRVLVIPATFNDEDSQMILLDAARSQSADDYLSMYYFIDNATLVYRGCFSIPVFP